MLLWLQGLTRGPQHTLSGAPCLHIYQKNKRQSAQIQGGSSCSVKGVGRISLGCMFYGETFSQSEAHDQLNKAKELGIRCFDTAEMYPVPQRPDTHGLSERYVGSWVKSQPRDQVQVSTKVCGPSGQMTWIRGGPPNVSASAIMECCEQSLIRMGLDYIDVLYIHWPDRYVPMFGESRYDMSMAMPSVPVEEHVDALDSLIKQGKIRAGGLSNETAYGLTRATRYKPGVVSVLQNAYSLTCRGLEESVLEVCCHEGVQVHVYSALAMGLLTGKYLAPGGGPAEARLNKFKGRYAEAESRYGPKPNVLQAVQAYTSLAFACGMQPAELALRFAISCPAVASVICGASNHAQLEQQCDAIARGPLPRDVLDAINCIHEKYPNPTP